MSDDNSPETKENKNTATCSQQVRLKHTWYQSESHVNIDVLTRNSSLSGYDVEFQERSVILKAKLPVGEDFTYRINLAHATVPSQSSFKVGSVKVEIKLKKAEGLQWTVLEGVANRPEGDRPPAYPSSSSHKKDWDKIEVEIKKEVEGEKPEGEDALNKLFQQIYANSTDEVRKAMNKSFVESGGTVLSTDWKEVSKKTVEVKPPEGVELKKWSQ